MLRFSCTALPDGGRMLSYTPVTDLVRHTDDPAGADYYRVAALAAAIATSPGTCAPRNSRGAAPQRRMRLIPATAASLMKGRVSSPAARPCTVRSDHG